MQFIAYILIYPILWIISIMPFRILYAISDGVYLLLYYVIGYRKNIVRDNIKLVFPEKSDQEIKSITKKFYHHMCDLFLEMIKTLTASRRELAKRFVLKNPETLKKLEATDNSIVVMYGHYASYEWSIILQAIANNPALGIYKTIANKYFDKLVRRIRSKYNSTLVDSKQALKRIEELHEKKEAKLIAFISDQSPKLKPNNYWGEFMGVTIPCFIGAELTSKKYDYPITYLKIDKVKRGYYESELIVLSENPREVPDFEITESFNRILEKQIKEAPEFYLWTHKRWKHRHEAPALKNN
ncbi:lysophospholipid acyltransferase family protein [Mangrovimonas sp. ST2L15]|uniref:lysophospholipid acyltransferase family protein n=1 Tax=Mangrovimonas sp. ST2L15 TaxID=1645916 RepID=UPI0006B55E2F|nr:lysophospholipid acyltransferase family protein [Mangrovimonas sp. ST2L15]